MKQLKFVLYSILAAAVLFVSGCSDDGGTNTPEPPSVKINYVAVRSVGGQYQLGIEFEAEAAATAVIYVDDLPAFSGIVSSLTKVREDAYETFLSIPDPGTSTHKVYVEVMNVSNLKGTSPEKTFTKLMKNALIEIVTSANCTPCAPANEFLREFTKGEVAKLRVIPVKYHVWWPKPTDSLYALTKTWCRPRVTYLFSPQNPTSAPSGYVDGQPVGETASNWLAQANIDMPQNPGADIRLSGSVTGTTLNLTIDVAGITTGNYSDLRLHTLVTESDIHYNDGNAEFVHYDVMKQMYPDENGEAVSIANGATQQFTRQFDLAAAFVKSNLHVVVFLQSNSTKTVLQVAKLNLK